MNLGPPCCAFTYDSDWDWGVTRTALGIACSWPDLCKEFDRFGSSCPVKNVIHFKTISIVGPKLFAVGLDNLKVFYHYGDRWHQYESARNVRLGKLKDFMEFFYDDEDNNNEDSSQQDNDGNDRDDHEPGRQAKDSRLDNNSTTYRINQAILYYCLLRLLPLIRLQLYLIQYQSFIR